MAAVTNAEPIVAPTVESSGVDLSQFTGHVVHLESFEGPLDLLLHLIRKDQVDIYNIPISKIVEQYLEYLSLMEQLDIQVAGEFLVMAATLLWIKSRMLLPSRIVSEEEEEEIDPRAALVQQLLEYQQFKQAADELKNYSDVRSMMFNHPLGTNGGEEHEPIVLMKTVSLFDLLLAFRDVLERTEEDEEEGMALKRETVTVGQKIRELLHLLRESPSGVTFRHVCQPCRRKLEVIVTFLALLELVRRSLVRIHQPGLFDEIRIFPSRDN